MSGGQEDPRPLPEPGCRSPLACEPEAVADAPHHEAQPAAHHRLRGELGPCCHNEVGILLVHASHVDPCRRAARQAGRQRQALACRQAGCRQAGGRESSMRTIKSCVYHQEVNQSACRCQRGAHACQRHMHQPPLECRPLPPVRVPLISAVLGAPSVQADRVSSSRLRC